MFSNSQPSKSHHRRSIYRNKFTLSIGTNYYILPSSLHEILLVPEDDDANAAVLTAMVQDVNITSLSPDEILSNHVYYYDQSRKKLIVCTKRK